MLKWLVIMFFALSGPALSAKKLDTALQSRINYIAQLSDSLTYSTSQDTRWEVSQALKDSLKQIILSPGSFDCSYDSFNTVAVVASKDERVRIFTWNFFNDSGFYQVNGVMQLNPKYFNEVFYALTPLRRSIDTLRGQVGPDEWLPALYYDIYTYKYKRKCYYILTGFNAGNPILRYNVVECLFLEKDQTPKFGKPIFKMNEQTLDRHSRLFFLYSGQATMVCKIEKKEKIIVVSSLVPVRFRKEGNRAYYAPDGTYDYYRYSKGIWYFKGMLEEFGGIGNKELNGRFRTE